MAFVPTEFESFDDGVNGLAPSSKYGPDAPDGDFAEFAAAGVGSIYYERDQDNTTVRVWVKAKNDGQDDDWVLQGGSGVLTASFGFADFTDGGGTSGTLELSATIPQGAYVERSTLKNLVGFTGDTSATIQVGDGSDVDRYSTGTPSVFTTANAVSLGAASGTNIHTSEVSTVTVTITSGSDWGAVTAGSATLCIYYRL